MDTYYIVVCSTLYIIFFYLKSSHYSFVERTPNALRKRFFHEVTCYLQTITVYVIPQTNRVVTELWANI